MSENKSPTPYVIVRSRGSGVFAGVLEDLRVSGGIVAADLTTARRIWYWAGAASLSELAAHGTARPDECKFPAPVTVTVFEVVEIISCTPEARASIEAVPVWTAHED